MKLAKFFFGLIFALTLALIGGQVVSMFVDCSPAIPAALFFVASLIPVAKVPKGALGLTIFSAPGGVGTPFAFNMTYLPQFLIWNDAVPLTSLRVQTAEDGVLHDWVAASIAVMQNFGIVGAITASQVIMRLADGQLDGKNVTISGVTSAAGVVPFRVSSERKGKKAFISKTAQILAGQPTDFMDFTALFIPTMATVTDRADIEYSDYHKQSYEMEELREFSVAFQETPQIMVNNTPAYIHKVTMLCAAATPAYILSVQK
jgi:hypothetical protein